MAHAVDRAALLAELDAAAARVNEAHAQVKLNLFNGLQKALEAGNDLLPMKEKVRRAGLRWLPWIAEKCPDVSERSRQIYMKLAANPQRAAEMPSIRAALKAIGYSTTKAHAAQKPTLRNGEIVAEDGEEEATATGSSYISLEAWKAFSADERSAALTCANTGLRFNKQTNESVGWARWTWNPVTGCLHGCPYCYARDIANHWTAAYPFGFDPVIIPARLHAAANTPLPVGVFAAETTPLPAGANEDVRLRNVFVSSMGDLFGRWVPAEWIEAVFAVCRANPQWNFLFLTKFPNRLVEFDDLPKNAWFGTTVDLQDRVANAEKSFAKLRERHPDVILWLSLEPLIERLTFSRWDLWNFVVIGGSSRSTQTPAWTPPFAWIVYLAGKFKDGGAHVFLKDNCFAEGVPILREFPGLVTAEPRAPDVFFYLSKPASATVGSDDSESS